MSGCASSLPWAKPTPKVPAVERDPWRLLSERAPEGCSVPGPAHSILTKCNAVPAKPVFPPRPPPLILDSDGAPEVPTSAEPQSCVIGPPHAPRPLSPEPAAVTSPGPSLDLENPASSPVKVGDLQETVSQHLGLGFQHVHDTAPGGAASLLAGDLDSSEGSRVYADSYQDIGEAEVSEADWAPEAASWSMVSGPSPRLSVPASVPDVSFIAENISAAVADKCAHLKLPWETGIYKDLFSHDPLSGFALSSAFEPWVGEVPSASLGVSDLGESLGCPPHAPKRTYISAGKLFLDVPDVPYETRVAKLREEALIKLVAFITALSRRDRPSEWPEHYHDQLETVSACVGVKSAFTLEKRANSLNVFLRWAVRNSCVNALLSEHTLWDFLKSSKRDGNPPSRMLGVASGLRFAQHVLGLTRAGETLSKRCLGLLAQMEATSVPKGQADALEVSDVLKLHAALRDRASCPWDRASAGYLVTCLYSRARASDFLRVSHVEFDNHGEDGFLELILKAHKGARSAKRKAQLLPVLAPSRGIDGLPWVEEVESAFHEVGLPFLGKIHGPLFRPPCSPDGPPGVREPRSKEITVLLHKFLSPAEGRRISSHSLKVTLLSWCSKFGINEHHQSMLGRHSDALKGAAPLYSRDLAVAPARSLQQVLAEVHLGNFVPDAPRSVAFPKHPSLMQSVAPPLRQESHSVPELSNEVEIIKDEESVQPPEPSPVEVANEEAEKESSVVPSSSDSSSSGSEYSSSEAEPVAKRVASNPWPVEDARQHVTSGSLHFIFSRTGGGQGIFACGRVDGPRYRVVDSTQGRRRCATCVKLAPSKSH